MAWGKAGERLRSWQKAGERGGLLGGAEWRGVRKDEGGQSCQNALKVRLLAWGRQREMAQRVREMELM